MGGHTLNQLSDAVLSASFVAGVLASVVAAAIIAAAVRISPRPIWKKMAGSRLFGRHGVEFVYKSQHHAEKDMVKDLQDSNHVWVLCARGDSVSQPDRPFHFLLDGGRRECRFLLADPVINGQPNPHVVSRAEEAGNDAANYLERVRTSVAEVRAAVSKHANLAGRLHQEPAWVRLYLCDDRVYVTFFQPRIMAVDTPVLSINKRSPLYGGFRCYFERTWDAAKPM